MKERGAVCLNCDRPVDTNFCGHCGQENTDYRVSLKRLLHDLADELFQIESRLWRSLLHLLIHPGRLTRDYNQGRRVRYTSPFRLYLLASVSYFFVTALLPIRADDARVHIEVSARGVMLGDEPVKSDEPPPTSPFLKKLSERASALDKLPPVEVVNRAREAFVLNVPRAMALLVPLFALLLAIFFRRRFYVEHLVFALHLHAFAFFALTLAALTRVRVLSSVALLACAVWTLLALRTVYAQSLLRISWKAIIIALLYAIALVLGIAVAVVVGLLF